MKLTKRLNKLLSQGISGNQAELVTLLNRDGIKTTQSTVSRALKKINAIRGVDQDGNTIYSLPDSSPAKGEINFFESLVLSILNNGHLIIIHTKPGTANTVAKFIDDHGFDEVMGTVAGDDTIMIVPADVNKTRQCAEKIERYLKRINIF